MTALNEPLLFFLPKGWKFFGVPGVFDMLGETGDSPDGLATVEEGELLVEELAAAAALAEAMAVLSDNCCPPALV